MALSETFCPVCGSDKYSAVLEEEGGPNLKRLNKGDQILGQLIVCSNCSVVRFRECEN